MNWNKLVTETRCEVEERDYEGSMDACMELWEEMYMPGLYDPVRMIRSSNPLRWVITSCIHYGDGGRDFEWAVEAETPQLAIIKAFLKSKGVTLEESE